MKEIFHGMKENYIKSGQLLWTKLIFTNEPHLLLLTAGQPIISCTGEHYTSAAHPELRHFPRRWVTPSLRAAAWPRSMAVAGELQPPAVRPLPAVELPSFAAACALVCRRYSCLVVAPHRRHVALSPRFLGRKRTGIRAVEQRRPLPRAHGRRPCAAPGFGTGGRGRGSGSGAERSGCTAHASPGPCD